MEPERTVGVGAGLSIVAGLALAALFVSGVVAQPNADPDMWHEMTLVREWIRTGALPVRDVFAYTPTVEPVVHHEWGTGVLLHALATRFGGTGIIVLRFVLAASIAACCWSCARRRGASRPVLWALLPLAALLSWPGFSPVRAQQFTMLMLAVLLWMLDLDRQGRRWWIVPWLALSLVWINLHAGFVVGMILLGAHALEQLARRRPVGHLVVAGVGMLGLVAVNPYGLSYYPYLWHALRMERPLITEWQPIWRAWTPLFACFTFSVFVVVYAAYRNGLRRMAGLLLVALTAYAAVRHYRHISLYAVAWACYVPGMVQTTPLGALLDRLAQRHHRAALGLASVVVIACSVFIAGAAPWRLGMAANPGEHRVLYPVGAVAYLESIGFEGNLMTEFTVGAFVSWRLHPAVRVSLDGRYEVAYEPELLDESMAFYHADPGWEQTLERHDTDALLVPRSLEVAKALPGSTGWVRAYRDDAYDVYVRPGLQVVPVDRSGETLVGAFP